MLLLHKTPRTWLTLTTLLSSATRLSTAQPEQAPFYNPFHVGPTGTSDARSYASLASTNASTTTMSPVRGAVIALSHGGGPMPLLGDPKHASIVSSLRTRVPELLRLGTPDAPRAIVVVTAHWSERIPTISSAATHKLLYDYSGFPPETYKLKYDAPGSPAVADEVRNAFAAEGLDSKLDAERGWDHGVFVPMLLVNPTADVPVVQVSVLDSEDASDHFRMGRALERLRDSNVAIVGSGFASFHNLRLFWSVSGDAAFREQNDAWSKEVTAAISAESAAEREDKVTRWREFPESFKMHPRGGAEHFLPLIVCAGAGGEGKAKTYADEFIGLDMWSYYWE